jgi:hypothetical protein
MGDDDFGDFDDGFQEPSVDVPEDEHSQIGTQPPTPPQVVSKPGNERAILRSPCF